MLTIRITKVAFLLCLTALILSSLILIARHSVSDASESARCIESQCFHHFESTERIAFGREMAEYVKHQFIEKSDKGGIGLQTVVIDAGHGGKDPGCLGKNSREKHITLSLSKQLAQRIKSQHPNITVVLTRDKDEFIPLHERARIANQNEADLFISIHCNYVGRTATHGSETYVMGLHRAEENLEVAKRENQAILLEDDFDTNYGGFDPNSPEGHIMLSMVQNSFLEQSIQFAEFVENEFVNEGRYSRGVKQAGFLVLRQTTMPSVLIEAGFLSNASEEQFLKSASGQKQMVEAIARAFNEYKEVLYPEESKKVIVRKQEKPKISKPEVKEQKAQPVAVKEQKLEPLRYKVQVAASKKKLDLSSDIWKKVSDLQILEVDGMYKYLSGSYENYAQAYQERKRLRELGFKGAFISTYRGDQRVAISK